LRGHLLGGHNRLTGIAYAAEICAKQAAASALLVAPLANPADQDVLFRFDSAHPHANLNEILQQHFGSNIKAIYTYHEAEVCAGLAKHASTARTLDIRPAYPSAHLLVI
jgi:hypothetical protein